MFKVSNRNTRKRCLLISKITLKSSQRRHLTTSCWSGVNIQNRVLDNFSQNIYQHEIKSLFSVLLSSSTTRKFNNSRPIYIIFWEDISLPKYFIHENSKCQHLFISKKTALKTDKFFNFLPYIQKTAISVSQS